MSHLVKDGNLLEYAFEDTKTLYEGFQRGMRASGELIAIDFMNFTIMTCDRGW